MFILYIFDRYFVQFYVNLLSSNRSNCSWVHIASHLLKTFELFNYSFNVFVSIVSGKYGRDELTNMLLCRSKTLSSNLNAPSFYRSSGSANVRYQLETRPDHRINPTHRPLLSNNCNHH
jgi:hypothetical protein